MLFRSRKINPALRIAGVLPVMYYRSKEAEDALRVLRLHDLTVFPWIRRSTMVDVMTYRQEPLIVSSPKSGACRDYKALAAKLAEGRY